MDVLAFSSKAPSMNVVMASISSLEILSGGKTGMIPKGALIWRFTTAAECPANGGANDEPSAL